MSWFVSIPQLPFSQVSNIVTDSSDDSLPPLVEEQGQPEHLEDQEETLISEIQRVTITSACHWSPLSMY